MFVCLRSCPCLFPLQFPFDLKWSRPHYIENLSTSLAQYVLLAIMTWTVTLSTSPNSATQVMGGNKWANAGKMKCNHSCSYTSFFLSLPNIRKILQYPTLYRHSRHIKSSTSCYATEQQPILIKTISELTLTRRQRFRFSPFSLQVPTHFLYQNLWCAG